MAQLLFVLFFCLSTLSGQTRIADDQFRSVPAQSAEEAWCPSPIFSLDTGAQVTVGKAWSAAKPCFVHFNLTPPASIDPISVQSFPSGTTIQVNQAVDDELYVYFRPPTYAGGNETRARSIVVLAKNPAAFSCSACVLESAGSGVRIFPQFSVPIGMLTVVGGAFHPAVDDIISKHQLYVGLPEGVVMRRDGTGFWVELTAQASVTARQQASLEQARTQALITALEPPPTKRQLASASLQAMDALTQSEQIVRDMQMLVEQRHGSMDEQIFMMRRELEDMRRELLNLQQKVDKPQ